MLKSNLAPSRLFGFIVLGCLLTATFALAKGQVGQSLESTHRAEPIDVQRLLTAVEDLDCGQPSLEDCSDDAYARTACGVRAAERLLNPIQVSNELDNGLCFEHCKTVRPTLELCQSTAWLNSVCGQEERRRMEVSLDDYGPGNTDVDHPSACVDHIRDAGETLQGLAAQTVAIGLPVVNVIVPSAPAEIVDVNGVATISDGTLLDYGYADPIPQVLAVPRQDWDFADLNAAGTGRFYVGRAIAEQAQAADPNNTEFHFAFDALRALWDTNGAAVEGCREYVYEKYYDFSQWEDRVVFLGSDARAKYEAAFDEASDPWAIGTRQLTDPPGMLRRKDGVPNDEQVQLIEYSRHKNDLFYVPVHDDAAVRDYVKSLFLADPTVVIFPASDTPETVTVAHPFSIGHIVFLDDDLDATLRDGRLNYKHNEDWDWHKARSDELIAAGYLDEELYALTKMRERIEQMLFEREVLSATWVSLYVQILGIPMDVLAGLPQEEVPFENGVVLPVGEFGFGRISEVLDSQRQESEQFGLNAGLPARVGVLAGISPIATALSGLDYGGTTMMAMSGGGKGNPFDRSKAYAAFQGKIAEFTDIPLFDLTLDELLQYGLPNRALAEVSRRITVADAQLEAALLDARDRGCLDLTGVNPCDWSPSTFGQRIHDPFMGIREKEFDRCLDFTSERGFSQLNDAEAASRFYIDLEVEGQPVGTVAVPVSAQGGNPVYDRVCNLADYSTNTDDVEFYFLCTERYRNELVKTLNQVLDGGGVLIDPETGDLSISESSSDADSFGGDVFSLGYDYEARWSVRGVGAVKNSNVSPPTYNYCALKPHLHAHVRAQGTAMGASFDLVDGTVDLGADPLQPAPHALLEIAGETLIDTAYVSHPVATSNPTFHVVLEDSEEINETIFSARTTIVVVFIPVTFRGGVAGKVGVNNRLGVSSGSDGAGNCQQEGNMALTSVVEPFVGVWGFASASIDAIVVEAGVKITLTVMQVSLPFRTELRFVGTQVGDDVNVEMNVSNQLDVVFSFMGGFFSAFVEFCFLLCETVEQTIFSWDAVRVTTNIFDTGFKIPLTPLIDVAETVKANYQQ